MREADTVKYRIGLDISGGDFAPQQIFEGAVLAKRELPAEITLIGVREEIEKEASRFAGLIKEFTIVDAPEKIGMGESPATSVRRKKNSSIVLGTQLLKEKKIDAFVSCGNTGAVVCAATLFLRLIEGVERPGIAIVMPTTIGASLIMDVGANVDAKPLHLLQYGAMASVYYSLVLNKENPTVGLLNIGEEESKGSDFVKNVHKFFSASSLNFIGNIEPKDIFSGKCDCVICDGFIGNITLKVAEGCGEAIVKFLIDAFRDDYVGKIGAMLLKGSLRKFKKKIDYAEYGGAPLLGVDGIVIIGHGRSSSTAVKNAIKVAIQELQRDINLTIKKKVNEICEDSRIRQMLAI